MVQKINPHPVPGCNRSPPYYAFSKDAILGSVPSIFSKVLTLQCSDSPRPFFPYFRRLKTKEKAIHKQLYLAMLIQVVVRLILYTDQFVSRKDQTTGSEGTSQEETRGIDNTVGTIHILRKQAFGTFSDPPTM